MTTPMICSIVTHPGGAHKDDLLAVCVLIAEHGVPVFRREPSVEDLERSDVAMVDVGGSHDPARMNFDHHHFPREHPPTCALSLVLDHLGLYRDAVQLCDWLEAAEWFDSRGPVKTAEHLNVPRRAVSQLTSPIDVTLLRRFAASHELSAGEPLYEFMRFVGADLLQYLRVARAQMNFVAAHAERWTIHQRGESIEAIFLPRTDPPAEDPSSAVANHVRDKGLETVIAAIVYPDRRGEGYGISRYEDHPRLDFARLQDQRDVRFAHKSGFMCKVTATDPERLKQLIAAAWTTESTSS
jgi:hypothetical protein